MFGAMKTHTFAVSRGIGRGVYWCVGSSWVPLPRFPPASLLGSVESIVVVGHIVCTYCTTYNEL